MKAAPPDGLEDALPLGPGVHGVGETLFHPGALLWADQPRSLLERAQPLLCLRHLCRGQDWLAMRQVEPSS